MEQSSSSANHQETSAGKPKEGGARRILGLALRFLVPLAITVALVWYMFTKIDFAELWTTIRHGVDYKWILLAMAISVVSHIFRAMRWRLQLRATGIRPPLMALCCSIFGTYALNLVFPRLGEVWRCTYIAQRQKAPFTSVLGTMVADRLADTVMVFLLLLLTLLVANEQISAFLEKYPVGRGVLDMAANPLVWVAVVVCAALIWLVYRFFGHTRLVKGLTAKIAQVWKGFTVVATMKGRGLFLLLTLGIWSCYFLQLYSAFFAFQCTLDHCFGPGTCFGLIPCLVAFVLSSIGMAIPSNGGLGPWNMAVVFGLMLYGVAEADAASMSIVVWSAQTIMLIILGIYTAIYISGGKRRDKELERSVADSVRIEEDEH